MRRVVLTLSVLAVAFSPRAYGAESQECHVRVTTPVVDDLGNHWKTGTVLPVDIARDGANGGMFCASGGSCLPRIVNGTSALTLLNCKVGPALGGGDFRLVPDASLSGPRAAAKLQSLQNAAAKLSALGFSNASAGTLADDYVNHPQSRNAQLVRKAFAGSERALAMLKQANPYTASLPERDCPRKGGSAMQFELAL